jgi:hypothetical protein
MRHDKTSARPLRVTIKKETKRRNQLFSMEKQKN